MAKLTIDRKLNSMNNKAFLRKLAAGGMNEMDALIAAKIAERRFPTPHQLKK